MLRRTMSVLTLILSFIFVSCSPKHSDIILSKFGNTEIKMGDFEKLYAKNAGSFEQAKKDSLSKLRNFLDLYTNFQMKLRDASVRGYDKDSTLNSELVEYKKKVGVSYILEKQLVEPSINQFYERRKFEFRVSHIMIVPDSTGVEAARKKAVDIIERIKKGEKFEDLCAKYSQDKYSKNNGGDLYYITSGMLTPELDNAIYAAPVGGIYPEPVHSRWGFHIIKVISKQDRAPQVRASHIMIDLKNDAGVIDTVAAKQKIDTVLQLIKEGKDFAQLAKKYSKDPGTKDNGGDLGFFERRQMVREFDETAFGLKVGEVSGIVKTRYGYHLIKLTEKKNYPTFEEDKEKLKTLYKQVSYNADYDSLVVKLEAKHNFKIDDANFASIAANKDSARLGLDFPGSKLQKKVQGKALFSVEGKTYSADSTFALALTSPEFSNKLIDSVLLKSVIKKVAGDVVLDEEALVFDKVSPDFATLMEDYKNGIYIFKLQDEEVWGKVSLDSVKLLNYYESTKANYVMPDRVNFNEIFVKNDSLKTVAVDLLKKGESFESVAEKYSEKKGENTKSFNWGLTEVSANELSAAAAKLAKAGAVSDPIQNNGGFSILQLVAKEASRLKTFEEAKAEVSGAFQESEGKRLEAEYLNKLKTIYQPVFYYENLEKAYKSE